jgi:hypothetical protein
MQLRFPDGYVCDIPDAEARQLVALGHATAVDRPGDTASVPRGQRVERAALDTRQVERAVSMPR